MATRVLLPREQVFSNIGVVGAGYRLFFYETGTTTKKDTYSDDDLATPNTNPVVADSAGRFGDIWVSDSSLYKCVLAPAGTDDPPTDPIWTADPINLNNSGILTIDPLPVAYWGATTGTSTAYLLEIPNLLVPIESYTNKQCFFVDFHIACGAAPTININELGVLNFKKKTQQGTKVALLAGDVQAQRHLCYNDGVDIVVDDPRTQMQYLGAPPTLTITTNEIIVSNDASNYLVDTSSGAQTLNTVTGLVAGQMVTFGINSNSNALTIANGADNIFTNDAVNEVLAQTTDKVSFISDGTNLLQLTRSIKTDASRLAKAWVSFDGTSSNPITPNSSYNTAATVVKNATGLFTVTFTVPFSSANYCVIISSKTTGSSGAGLTQQVSKLAGSYQFYTTDASGSAADSAAVDLVFFGAQ
jgi:hypothetical protein